MKLKKVAARASMFVFLAAIPFALELDNPAALAQSAGCTDQALALAEGQLTDTVAYADTSQFPVETNPSDGNKWDLDPANHWTSGFFPGWIWFMYERTLSAAWLARAQAQTAAMQAEDTNAADHDIGFKMLASFGNGYRITREPAYMTTLQTAAQAMSSLYRPGAGVIESWPNYDSHITVIIDNMMNLELLFFAAQNDGDPNWYNMAVSHAVRTMQNHVRSDGSTYHVVDYNSDGTVFSKFTAQGAGNETTWARGQAWGLYGFTMTYRYTRDPRFLDTAQRLADYFINNLPADFVPYWDFSKSGTEPRDSSAAAIAAAGLLELSTFATTQADQDRYRNAALNIQTSLSSSAYLGDRVVTDGILLHGSANVPGGDSDKSLIYGDYYFIQGCYRARTVPPAPSNLRATAASATQNDLVWDALPGAVRYNVKRSTKLGGPYTLIAPPPLLTTNSFTDSTIAAGSNFYYVVSATNIAGEGPDSAESAVLVSNPAPAISSLSPSHVAAGSDFSLTVNGTNFLSNSLVNLNGKAELTTFVSSTRLTAAIPANDMATGGTPQVTVSNASAGGGISTPLNLMIDDFSISGPASATLSSSKSAVVPITVAPNNANGFANSVAFSVSGLPAGTTASFNPPTLTPGVSGATTTLTISTATSAEISPRLSMFRSSIWATVLIATLLLFWPRRLQQPQTGQLAFACLLLLFVGGTLGGCGGAGQNTPEPPPSPQTYKLTVTAQSGVDTKTTTVNLTVP